MCRKRALLFVFLLASSLLAARLLAQDAADSYQAGLDAFQRKDFGAAADAFRQAVRRKPGEQRRLHISGTFFHEYYLPHFFLGLSLKEIGDAPGARAELLLSKGQGLVSQHPAYGPRLNAALLELETKATSSAPLPSKPVAIPTATAAAATAATQRPDPSTPPGPAAGVPPVPAAAGAQAGLLLEKAPASEARTVLRNGVRLFFRGDYDGALKTLSGLSDAGNETARLFAAYAMAGSVLAGGREAGPELPRARALYESLPARARPKSPSGVSARILEALSAPAAGSEAGRTP
ncbi:MAG: hypothetical protein PT977_01095 [Acidobacteriota bacterium]|nr:hypothetical protein [Acidobacteriota bacterium]